MSLRQAGVISLPHIDEKYFSFFGFSVCCVDLEVNRVRKSQREFEVCKIPMPLKHSHSDNMRLRRRKSGVEIKEKQKSANLCEVMTSYLLASSSLLVEKG